MVGFYLNDLQQLRMLARVPIISAYDPSRESMLAYASPSNKIAIMITGLVIDCLGTNNFLVTKSSLLKLTQLCLHLNSPYFLFLCSLLSCKLITHKYRGSQQFSIRKSVEPSEELKVEQIFRQVLSATDTTLRTLNVRFTQNKYETRSTLQVFLDRFAR